MDIGNNHENKHLQLRIARGLSLVALGGALMSRLPQLLPGQLEPSWYQSPFMIAGIIVALIGLLILFLPSRCWERIWQAILATPTRLTEIYVWMRYGPKYTIDNSTIISDFSKTEVGYEVHYTADIDIHIKAKGRALKVGLSSAKICIEQKIGWEQHRSHLYLETHRGIPEKFLEPREEWHDKISVSADCRGPDRESFIDTQKYYRFRILGIRISLLGGVNKWLETRSVNVK